MSQILNTKSIYYNDVNLIAKPAVISSRLDVPIELNRIIVSPMHAVIGLKFAKEATDLGLTICLHKFCKIETAVYEYTSINKTQNVFVSVGLNDWERVTELSNVGVTNWLIDCANGYLPQVQSTVYKLCNTYPVNRLMVGNVMTGDGVILYKNILKDFNIDELILRIGIAGGSACATSDVTGYNRGQITELIECSKEADLHNINIVADGGVKNGNYAAKAYGAGSNYVMMGGYFAKALEAYTWECGDGTYWGGASTKQQELYGGVRRHSEGKVYDIDKSTIKPLKELVNDIWCGITSAISYSGYKSLTEFIGNGIFEIKQNSLPPTR